MYNYFFDLSDKKISWKVKGSLNKKECQTFFQEMKRNIHSMGEGFSLLIDLEEAETFFPENSEEFQKIIQFCREHGMKRCACVIEDSAWVKKLQCSAEDNGTSHMEVYVPCRFEAESFLNRDLNYSII